MAGARLYLYIYRRQLYLYSCSVVIFLHAFLRGGIFLHLYMAVTACCCVVARL